MIIESETSKKTRVGQAMESKTFSDDGLTVNLTVYSTDYIPYQPERNIVNPNSSKNILHTVVHKILMVFISVFFSFLDLSLNSD